VLEIDGGPGEQYELGRQRGGKQEFTSCNVTEFFNIPDAHQLQMLALFAVDFGACRAWIIFPGLFSRRSFGTCACVVKEKFKKREIRKGEKRKAGERLDLA